MFKIKVIGLLLGLFLNIIFADVKIIIKYKINSYQQKLVSTNQLHELELRAQMMKPLSTSMINSLENKIGYRIQELNPIAIGAHVIRIESNLSEIDVNKVINKIKEDPNIEYVEKSIMMHANSVVFNNAYQWDMLNTGDNFESLYNNNYYVTNHKNPGESIVVVVIDTGYTPHPNYIDSNSNLHLAEISCGSTSPKNGYDNKCYGYQFISSCYYSNESNCNLSENIAYHPDGLDLGTYYCSSNGYYPVNCREPSIFKEKNNYHGSHVAGSIVSQGYKDSVPASMLLGGANGVKVLPIRSLGLAGSGDDVDIINAIAWSVGSYSSIPNPLAAQVKVINMSLGGSGECGNAMQEAINYAISKNVIVVVSAGNDHIDFTNSSPANCKGVISVSAKYPNQLAYYSNYGNTTITASGGSASGLNNIYSTVWGNESKYSYGPTKFDYKYSAGTSMAAPHVSAAVADIVSYLINKNIAYSNDDIITILQNSARMLSNNCSSYGCVSGKTLDAAEALNYTIRNYNTDKLIPYINNESITSLIIKNNNLQRIKMINLNAESLFIASTYLNDNGFIIPLIIESNSCNNKLLIKNDECSIFLRLNGYINFNSLSLQMKNAESKIVMNLPIIVDNPSPNSSSGGSGGGCSIVSNGDDYSVLLLLAIVIIFSIRRRFL